MRGIVTVLNTPFLDDDSLDLAGFEKNVRNALHARVAGFLVPAMASEVGKLREDERLQLVEITLREVNARVPVIGGASAASQTERLAMARKLVALGCPGVLASLRFESREQYEKEVRELAEVGAQFIMVQDWDEGGYGAPVDVIARIFEELPTFRCLKVEVVPAGVKYSAVLDATHHRLHVSGGWAVQQMIEALDRGVHAFMPTGMHRIYVEIYRRYADGDRSGARELHESILPVLAFSNQHLDISIHFFKRLLWRQGTFRSPRVRAPILPFDTCHERIADELINRVLKIESELP
jgi:dihydrodipicolinate synthase/N-acetylneuraminate lyase